jgi:HK97 family phage portal protein
MADRPGLLARIFGAPIEKSAVPAGPVMSSGDGFIPPHYPWNWWQRAMPTGTSGDSATVNACVNAYAQTIAQLQAGHFYRADSGKPEKIRTSALSRILRNPNGYQTRSDFMTNLVTDIMFQGNAYAWATRNQRQEIEALHLMPARSTSPHVDPETGAIFYALGTNPIAGKIDYLVPARDVLHIRGRCRPGEPLRGISPLTWATSAQAANVAITGTQAAFFNNASQPSGVLSAEAALTREQMERLRAAWREHSAGFAAGEVPILGGGLKWVPMGITAQDAQLVEAFGMTVADIASAFGVPLPIIGDLSASTFNNTEQLISLWLSTGLGYWVEHIEIAFDKFFALPAEEYTELDTDTLLRTAFKDRIDGLTKAVTGGLYSPNEARRKEGLGDVDFGDEPRLQAQVVPLSAVDKIQTAPSAPIGAAPTVEEVASKLMPVIDARFLELQDSVTRQIGDSAIAAEAAFTRIEDSLTRAMDISITREMDAVAAKAWELARPEIEITIADRFAALPPPDVPPSLVAVEAREDMAAREHVTVHRMSDGSEFESRSKMMPGVLPLDYAALGWGVIKGDMIRDGDLDRTALVDNPSIGRADHWSVREVRGRRGRPGPSAVPAPATVEPPDPPAPWDDEGEPA